MSERIEAILNLVGQGKGVTIEGERLMADEVERLRAIVDGLQSAIADAYTSAYGPYRHATSVGEVKRILAKAGAEKILHDHGLTRLCKWGT